MFGYVRPLTGELKVWELERYKAAYCGLCRAIKADYSLPMTFTLNYDFAFLTLLLTGLSGEDSLGTCRCAPKGFMKRPAVHRTPAVASAAAASVILFKWKLKDELADEKGAAALRARAALLFFKRGFKKATARLPEFDQAVRENIERLRVLENAPAPGLDAPADTFACILASLAVLVDEGPTRRCLRELLYHTGRWIYIIDACQDLKEDMESGSFNPLTGRFALTGPELSPDHKANLTETLNASSYAALAAANLLALGKSTGIIENILALGMPAAVQLVLSGKWKSPSPTRHPRDLQ